MAIIRGPREARGRAFGAALGLALTAALGLAACGGAGANNGANNGAYGGAYGGGSTSMTGSGGGSSAAGVNLQCAAGAEVCVKTVMVSGKSQTALADTKGMTLYYFTPDSASTATCTGSCAQNWPPLAASGSTVSGTNLPGALTSINSSNGAQVEYNGHPLYRYAGDTKQSDTTGEGLLGKWYVATPSLAAAGGAPATSPTNTPGGGYGAGGY